MKFFFVLLLRLDPVVCPSTLIHPVYTKGTKDESTLLALWTSRMVVVLDYFMMPTAYKINNVECRRSECGCGGFIGGKVNDKGQQKQPEERLFKCQFCPPRIHIDNPSIEPGLVLQDNRKITRINSLPLSGATVRRYSISGRWKKDYLNHRTGLRLDGS